MQSSANIGAANAKSQASPKPLRQAQIANYRFNKQ